MRDTYCLTTDIRMPDLGVKAHLRWLEGVVVGKLDANQEFATSVRRISRAIEPALESRQRALMLEGSVNAGCVLVLGQILQLLHDTTISAGHDAGLIVAEAVVGVRGVVCLVARKYGSKVY